MMAAKQKMSSNPTVFDFFGLLVFASAPLFVRSIINSKTKFDMH